MTKSGTLSVELKSDSDFFGLNAPIEVRDSKMRLVKRAKFERQLDLPAGLYEVSAVLEDGRRHSQVVQIKDGEQTLVELGISEQSKAPERPAQFRLLDMPAYERPRYTQKMESLPDAGAELETGTVAQLMDVQGASLMRETRTLWVFECAPELDSVPTALFQINDRKMRISLPISPEREFPYNSCVVQVQETRTRAHANAWIAPERTVANALQNMLASGYVLHAAEVAVDAVELLRYKYSDPTGAALGALILHKVGRLGMWTDWVENLAGDFEWLPDGKVMLAILWHTDQSRMDQALDLALQASAQRMLYTESYSLLLDLLRRWPRESDHEARQQAIGELASRAPDVDWESICLSQVLQEEE